MYISEVSELDPLDSSVKRLHICGVCACACVLTLVILTSDPFYDNYSEDIQSFPIPSHLIVLFTDLY